MVIFPMSGVSPRGLCLQRASSTLRQDPLCGLAHRKNPSFITGDVNRGFIGRIGLIGRTRRMSQTKPKTDRTDPSGEPAKPPKPTN